VLLHVVTEKGHGFKPAAEDPVTYFHTPARLCSEDDRDRVVSIKKDGRGLHRRRERRDPFPRCSANPRVTVLTAAMCQGNKLERSATIPRRASSTPASASRTPSPLRPAGEGGLRPIVDIYSTFLQRSYDQIFQEVALQNLPVTFMLDRAGLTGPDGPTHHGVFDIGYMRVFPNMVVHGARDDAYDLPAMLDFRLQHDRPCFDPLPERQRRDESPATAQPIELGKAEVIEWGTTA
jgi:1-deoxy-D-xylulose-5-phosphate synthase